MGLKTILLNKYYVSKEQKQFGVWMDTHHATPIMAQACFHLSKLKNFPNGE